MNASTIWARSILAASLAHFVLAATPALAQSAAKGGGKIICWKDKSGKVVGCGDTVPPEFQASGTRELDQRGVTRKTTESEAEAAKRRDQEKELAAQKAAEEKRLSEQRRSDSALLASYTTAEEIDQRRDRDLQPVDQQISTLQTALKTAKPEEKANYQQGIAAREKEKEAINQKYAAQKQRFLELKGGAAPGAPSKPATAVAPTPAPAKK